MALTPRQLSRIVNLVKSGNAVPDNLSKLMKKATATDKKNLIRKIGSESKASIGYLMNMGLLEQRKGAKSMSLGSVKITDNVRNVDIETLTKILLNPNDYQVVASAKGTKFKEKLDKYKKGFSMKEHVKRQKHNAITSKDNTIKGFQTLMNDGLINESDPLHEYMLKYAWGEISKGILYDYIKNLTGDVTSAFAMYGS